MFQVHLARPARHIHLHAIVYLSHHPTPTQRLRMMFASVASVGFWVLGLLCCVCSRQHDMNTFMWTSECIVPTKTGVCKQGVWWTHHAMFKPPQNIGAWETVPSFSLFYRNSLSFCDIYRKSLGISQNIEMQRSCCDIFSWLRYFFVFLRYFFQREFCLR